MQDTPTPAGVRISHPERVIYPDPPTTKLQVAQYYDRISKWIVPHLAGRPLTLVRCPEGLRSDCIYMKHSKVWAPAPLRRVRIQEKTKLGEYLIADDPAAVVGLVQMGVLEIHTWNSSFDQDVERPNRIVIDLDPGEEVAWPRVAAAARVVRGALEALDLESYPKTTGGRGVHVVVPLVAKADWSQCLLFARRLCEVIERTDPDLYTTQYARAGREKKILLDYLRNNRTNTSVAAYSTRARPGATVSVPLAWSELRSALDPRRFTIATVPNRLQRLKSDPWKAYWGSKQMLTGELLGAVDTASRH
jgi:bifunctional non-homologous end joining protein LigD